MLALSSIVQCVIWFFYPFLFFSFFFFSVSKAKSSGVFVEKFDAFSRFSMVVSSITCTVRRDRSKEVKTQVKKIAERMARLTRTFLFIMYKRKNKKKEKKNLKKNVSQFDDERACSIFYLRLVVFLLFFFFSFRLFDYHRYRISFVLVSFY